MFCKMILIDGTSSSGKTTISKYLNRKNYKSFHIDDYNNDKRINKIKIKLYKKIQNKYGEYNKIRDIEYNIAVKYMVEDAIKSKRNIVFDISTQKEIIEYINKKYKKNKLFIINLYTNLEGLIRNLKKRMIEGDRRSIRIFYQFADRYVKTEISDKNKIDKINKRKFKKILSENLKYEFENKEELNKFCNDVFERMGIKDNKSYYIKLRDEYKYDYILNTSNKTKRTIFNEINNILEKL